MTNHQTEATLLLPCLTYEEENDQLTNWWIPNTQNEEKHGTMGDELWSNGWKSNPQNGEKPNINGRGVRDEYLPNNYCRYATRDTPLEIILHWFSKIKTRYLINIQYYKTGHQ